MPALVTTSSAGTPIANAGVLGLPTTGLLFGDEGIGGDIQSGVRLTVGTWLGADRSQGIEASVLALGESGEQFGRYSTDTPILARPFFDEPSASQAAMVVAHPGRDQRFGWCGCLQPVSELRVAVAWPLDASVQLRPAIGSAIRLPVRSTR